MAKLKADFGANWASVTDVRAALTKAQTSRAAQQRLLGSLSDRIERRRADIESSLSDIQQSQRTPLVNKAVAGFRMELRRESGDQRLAHVREVAKHREFLKSAKGHYRSSAQMLARATIGSERRSRIQQQISNSGPAELASLAELAAATRDMEMAAALCSRVFDMEPTKRPFNAADLADTIVGDEFREVTSAINEVERLALEALDDDSRFETAKSNPHRSLQIAMMKRGAETPYTENDEEDND